MQNAARLCPALPRSRKAEDVLRKWDDVARKVVKVFPKDYKRALTERIEAGSGNG